MREYKIPVIWKIKDNISVKAETLEKAIEKLKEKEDELTLDASHQYLDATCRIDDGSYGNIHQ